MVLKMPHDYPIPLSKRTIEQEKVTLNKNTHFQYIQRGIDRTPRGTKVEISKCSNGIKTTHGEIKGTAHYGLYNVDGHFANQYIAWSTEVDDLILFAIEHEWLMDHPNYDQLVHELYN